MVILFVVVVVVVVAVAVEDDAVRVQSQASKLNGASVHYIS
jgi:hypothetical protein